MKGDKFIFTGLFSPRPIHPTLPRIKKIPCNGILNQDLIFRSHTCNQTGSVKQKHSYPNKVKQRFDPICQRDTIILFSALLTWIVYVKMGPIDIPDNNSLMTQVSPSQMSYQQFLV